MWMFCVDPLNGILRYWHWRGSCCVLPFNSFTQTHIFGGWQCVRRFTKFVVYFFFHSSRLLAQSFSPTTDVSQQYERIGRKCKELCSTFWWNSLKVNCCHIFVVTWHPAFEIYQIKHYMFVYCVINKYLNVSLFQAKRPEKYEKFPAKSGFRFDWRNSFLINYWKKKTKRQRTFWYILFLAILATLCM